MSNQPPPPGAPSDPPSGPPSHFAPPPGWAPPPGAHQAPPPGWVPPPGAQQQPYAGPPPGYAPAWAGPPVHKPGIVPLRPLSLGDLYDGAFKAIRQNPKTMVGLAALVTTAFMLIPALASLGLALTDNLMVAPELAGPGQPTDPMQEAGVTAAQAVGALFAVPATVVLTGICVYVVHQGALGRRTSIGEAWTAARGQLLRLLGLTLLSGLVGALLLLLPVGLGVLLGFTVEVWLGVLVGVLGGLGGLLVLLFLQIRLFYLAPAALMLERSRVRSALGRAWTLTRGQFWRLFGIWLLTSLVVGLVSQVLAVPASLIGVSVVFFAPASSLAGLMVVLSGYVSTVIVGAVTTPFLAGVSALLYLDQRIRKEAYDVELTAASQSRAS